jgi:hypothetical protein
MLYKSLDDLLQAWTGLPFLKAALICEDMGIEIGSSMEDVFVASGTLDKFQALNL